jgi:hypothetical protein
VVNNATTSLEFPAPLPAGNYYLEQSHPEGTVGWWTRGSPFFPRKAPQEIKKDRASLPSPTANKSVEHRVISVKYQGDDEPTVLEAPQATTPAQREQVAREIRDFFTFRKGQPSYFDGPHRAEPVELA